MQVQLCVLLEHIARGKTVGVVLEVEGTIQEEETMLREGEDCQLC